MTSLPHAEQATVDPAKVRDYLLSTVHLIGRFKARFFESFGYTSNNWTMLQDDLLRLAASGEARAGQPSKFGVKFEVTGSIVGPNGRSGVVVSVWLVREGEDAPRFITAYPG